MLDDPLIGRQLANFRVERVLGRGGMAQVYYGWDVTLERPVALKVIDVRYRGQPAYADRFLREAQSIATWRHENIVQVYYAGNEDGLYFYVMELVSGRDLSAILADCRARDEQLPQDEALRIGRAVAEALDYAHARGVVHRDVKPANIIVAGDGRVVLTDFGLALAVEQGSSGEAFGTPRYMAPEQARHSADAVPQSDLYALGVVLYEMLTGVAPFTDPSPTSVAIQHMTMPPPPPRHLNPRLSEGAEVVLLKALRKVPADRYQTGRALLDDLARGLAGALPLALPPPTDPFLAAVAAGSATGGALDSPPALVASLKVGWRRLWSPWLLLAVVTLLFFCTVGGGLALVARLRGLTGGQANGPGSQAATAAARAGLDNFIYLPLILHSVGATPAVAPTVTLPAPEPAAGRTLHFYYNDSSFYVWNPGESGLPIGSLALEALDAAGQPAGYDLSGGAWARFFHELQAGRCVRLEILSGQGYLRPSQCRGYNATLTPQAGEDRAFWLPRQGVTHFRVTWNGQEAGRCDIGPGARECQVSLP